MLRQLLATGDRRPLTLYWGGRTRGDLYEDAWLTNLAAVRPFFAYRPVLSEADAESSVGALRTGFVHEAVLEDFTDLSGHDVYASGPPAMVEAIRTSFIARGLPREQLFFDSFDYAPDTVARMRAAQSAPRP
jgi:CDP-4-dehydro-6-deoxyglucose reductase